MEYLSFDKTLLVNLDRSLKLEMIHTNRSGAFNATTLVGCNTRKYHGELIIPAPDDINNNLVLLSSLDETIVHYGAEFNLAVHQYGPNTFSPNGHKYIRKFECQTVAKIIYRLGNVILCKEKLLVSLENRVLIKYTLMDGGTGIFIRFKPFLAFRNTNNLTYQNNEANTNMSECKNGQFVCLYNGYPNLFMQFSKTSHYFHNPTWYKNIMYFKERDRGYQCYEDLLVPGYFEVELKRGESLIFSGGTEAIEPSKLKKLWNEEASKRFAKDDVFTCLKNAAEQFYKKVEDKCYLLAGYPWFGCSAREEFFATPSCTLDIDNIDFWDAIIDKTAVEEVNNFVNADGKFQGVIKNIADPDALLWLIRAFQKYAHKFTVKQATDKYADICLGIIKFYQHKKHPQCVVKPNGLLYIRDEYPTSTWMNYIFNNSPITPRYGYVVELNALWYNALCFVAEMFKIKNDFITADLIEYQADIVKQSFCSLFWNGIYLNDYVADNTINKEVRPNQIWAVGLPYSPLDTKQQKSVVDICTRELLTPRGLRTLSPQSGLYHPMFSGNRHTDYVNYHNGVVWPFTIAAYSRAYMSVYKKSGMRFMERLLIGFEEELKNLCVCTLNEFYDGTPPYKGHGAMSYAPSVAAVISIIDTLTHYNNINE